MIPQDAMAATFAHIAASGGERVFPPSLLPARVVLELSGEAVRSRLCVFTDAEGREVCLRPDMTTPIASQVASGALAPARYTYAGSVYRLPNAGSDGPIEFSQAGFEWFGGGGADEDADATALALGAASSGGASGDLSLRIGDVSVLVAVINALPFSPAWRARLKRAFFRRRGPRDLLNATPDTTRESGALAAALAALPPTDAVRAVEEILATAGVLPVGGRGAAEIAERLRDSATDIAPDTDASRLLTTYLDIEAPLKSCAKRLSTFARDAGVDLAPAIDGLATRIDQLATLKPPFLEKAQFSAEAGRRFEYYDGFVFELGRADEPARPIASGGRYDGLIARLSAGASSSPAIGAALRIDRLSGEGAR